MRSGWRWLLVCAWALLVWTACEDHHTKEEQVEDTPAEVSQDTAQDRDSHFEPDLAQDSAPSDLNSEDGSSEDIGPQDTQDSGPQDTSPQDVGLDQSGVRVELTPSCVHVPFVVGETIPIAVLGEGPCATYSHAEHSLSERAPGDYVLDVRLWGTPLDETCPPCIQEFGGLVEIPNDKMGTIEVRVAGQKIREVMTTSGILPEPFCDDGCGELPSAAWTVRFDSPDEPEISCGLGGSSGMFNWSGECQHYILASAGWRYSPEVFLCTQDEVYFGETWGEHGITSGTLCEDPAFRDYGILGVANSFGEPAAFLLEGNYL